MVAHQSQGDRGQLKPLMQLWYRSKIISNFLSGAKTSFNFKTLKNQFSSTVHHCLFLVLWDQIYFLLNLSSLHKVWYEFFCFKFGRIFLHFIKACPDLPWLDQIYCSGYKLYCRRYWPDLPEMCRKWLPRKKIDRPNNFCRSAFFLRSFCFPPTTLRTWQMFVLFQISWQKMFQIFSCKGWL